MGMQTPSFISGCPLEEPHHLVDRRPRKVRPTRPSRPSRQPRQCPGRWAEPRGGGAAGARALEHRAQPAESEHGAKAAANLGPRRSPRLSARPPRPPAHPPRPPRPPRPPAAGSPSGASLRAPRACGQSLRSQPLSASSSARGHLWPLATRTSHPPLPVRGSGPTWRSGAALWSLPLRRSGRLWHQSAAGCRPKSRKPPAELVSYPGPHCQA
mmetsp:Transcript_107971/g.328152  ORF Transcript_107971/g.328152 Transcript_107971/m.328152 type:complete len:212 (+) Transcript_107971:1-636(+)